MIFRGARFVTQSTSWFSKANRIVWIAAASAVLAACSLSPEADAAAIEADILSTPGSEELWSAIKLEYPEDFAALVAQIQALDFSERRDATKVEQVGATWLRRFFDRITADAVRAPAAELVQWSLEERQLYRTLQANAENECAAMTMGEWIFVDQSNIPVSRAIARRNAAMVRASAAGKRDPQDYGEPSDAAFGRLGDSIAATGLRPELQATLGSNEAMLALTRQEQCEIGVAVYSGLSNLPDDVEPQMAAYMLAPE